jgi:hypothetical protein
VGVSVGVAVTVGVDVTVGVGVRVGVNVAGQMFPVQQVLLLLQRNVDDEHGDWPWTHEQELAEHPAGIPVQQKPLLQ